MPSAVGVCVVLGGIESWETADKPDALARTWAAEERGLGEQLRVVHVEELAEGLATWLSWLRPIVLVAHGADESFTWAGRRGIVVDGKAPEWRAITLDHRHHRWRDCLAC